VRAIAVCPGPTRTEFAGGSSGGRFDRAIPRDDPRDVVRATWTALAAGRTRVSTGTAARLAAAAARIAPRRLVVGAAGALHRPRGARQ
jgi:short-subunit dehydrogenase